MGSAEIGEAKGKFSGLSFRTYVRSAYIGAYADVPTYANVRMRVRPAPRIRPVRAITYHVRTYADARVRPGAFTTCKRIVFT